MKNARKLASLLLALVMVFALATTAFAADTNGSITITNPVGGQTYNAYLMFELESYNTETGAYSYKITEDWREFVTTGAGTDYFTVDSQDYVTLKTGVTVENDSVAAANIAKAAVAYAAAKNLTPAATLPKDGSYTATGLTLGYYVVDSSLGALCGLTTTKPSATINEKNEVPTIDKVVKEDDGGAWGDSNTAQIGDTVEFKTTIHAKKGAQNYKLHDQMEAGLTLNKDSKDSIVVKVGETQLTKDTDYTVAFDVACKDKNGADATCDFEITFSNDYLATITADTDIVVTYTAILNENAEIADATNDNDTVLDYGDDSRSEWSETVTKTYQFEVLKYAANDTEKNPLADATFQLKDASGNVVKLVKVSDTEYRVANGDETGAVDSFTTVASGKIVIKGVDLDTYTLVETAAPAGYNKLNQDKEFTVTADQTLTVEIPNNSGTELPSTGGMGTTIFYVLGSVLVLGAAVLLVTKKRMSMKG